MIYQYTPYIWPFIGTMIMNLFMIFYLLKKRRMNGAVQFVITMLLCSLWCMGTAMETSALALRTKLFWAKTAYPAYAFAPLVWLVMSLELTDWRHWINRKRILWLSIIPITTVILTWTNDWHGLIWQHVSLRTVGSLQLLDIRHGLWFWIHAVYSDGLNLFSVFLLILFWRRNAPLYGRQYRYLAFSMVFVMLVNLAYVLGIGPMVDPTPIAWGVSSFFITWVLFRDKLFDLMPIARNRVMESMTEGIVVLDLKDRIADINPAAKDMFHIQTVENIGSCAETFFANWLDLRSFLTKTGEDVQSEISVRHEERYYQASCMPIKNERGNLLGKLLIIRDITEQKLTEQQLLQKQQEIAVQRERESIARDLHDNLGQILGFINVQTQAVQEYLKHDQLTTALQCLERLTEVAQNAHETVRSRIIAMRGDLEPSLKKNIDFVKELTKLISWFEKKSAIPVMIDFNDIPGFDRYGAPAATQALSIINESLNNIIKHSRASSVKIKFVEDQQQGLSITLTDDGCGFDVAGLTTNPGRRYGLSFMKERGAEIGGHVNVHSQLGKGTIITIQIPRHREEAAVAKDC